jgi:hypothetical protein
MQSVTFLFLLQLQLQYHYEAVQAGAIVAVSAIGALALKPFTRSVVGALGFKAALIGNSVLGGVLILGFTLFGISTPVWVFVGYTFLFGLVRSLHFNTINSLTYADIPPVRQGPSISLGVALQQLTMALGISLASIVISFVASSDVSVPDDFAPAFWLMALFPMLSAIGFIQLRHQDGADVSGRNAHPKSLES